MDSSRPTLSGSWFRSRRWIPFSRGRFRTLEYLVRTSPNLAAGLGQLKRFHTLYNGRSTLEIVEVEEGVEVQVGLPFADEPFHLVAEDFALAAVCGMFCNAAGTDLRPAHVSFRHAAPADSAPYHASFGASLDFNCRETVLAYANSSLERPMLDADPVLADILENCLLEAAEAHGLGGDKTSDRVRQLLMESISDPPSLPSVAKSLEMSQRSLQIRLTEEGTKFHDLLDSVRERLAKQYLRRPELNILDTALLLDYSGGDSFGRAFKRWTGETPREYRRSVLG